MLGRGPAAREPRTRMSLQPAHRRCPDDRCPDDREAQRGRAGPHGSPSPPLPGRLFLLGSLFGKQSRPVRQRILVEKQKKTLPPTLPFTSGPASSAERTKMPTFSGVKGSYEGPGVTKVPPESGKGPSLQTP